MSTVKKKSRLYIRTCKGLSHLAIFSATASIIDWRIRSPKKLAACCDSWRAAFFQASQHFFYRRWILKFSKSFDDTDMMSAVAKKNKSPCGTGPSGRTTSVIMRFACMLKKGVNIRTTFENLNVIMKYIVNK